jgi:6,7-dimethyl-8-ribityllumazine synthase
LVYCFGVVIRGETTHYETVCSESARWIIDMTLKFKDTWIIMWILTCENKKQVEERINESLAISGLNLLSVIKKLW